MDIFFALSGFLVGDILIKGRGRKNTLRKFAVRRSIRILPLYLAVLSSFYIFRFFSSRYDWMFSNAAPWWSYFTLTQNFATPITGRGAYYLGSTWSLAVEVQIYIAIAFAITITPSKYVTRTMISGLIFTELCRLMFVVIGLGIFGYFVLPARIDGACFGVITALMLRSTTVLNYLRRHCLRVWVLVVALFAVAECFSVVGQGPGSLAAAAYTHLALAFASSAAIAVLIANPDKAINCMLRSRPLVALGTASYGIYLLHIPVMGTIFALSGRTNINIVGWSTAAISAIGLAATVGLSTLSWRYFESPLIRISHRISHEKMSAGPTALHYEPIEVVRTSRKAAARAVRWSMPIAAVPPWSEADKRS